MCPRCDEPLIVVELHGVALDHCVGCGGTWLDRGELELIVELAGGQPERMETALAGSETKSRKAARCPRCARKMRVVTMNTQPPVEVDLCPAGEGFWLDWGELGAVVRAHSEREEAELVAFLGELFQDELTTRREESKS